ncbi:MAG: DNA repair protein RecO [Candidatus Lambdaproteobacteria bacterium]|nr:DNA repair protein RecO [Candidatus Lambdaproteobacteria bacterium]
MKPFSSECIVLAQRPYRERDRLVSFLARDRGRLAGIARGAQKLTGRGVGSYEPCTRGVIHYVESRGTELVSIRKCDPQPPYLFLEQDYAKYLYAAYFAEWLTLCPVPAAEAERFFLLLAGGIEAVCAAGSAQALAAARLAYELELLACLGLLPEWGRCCACGRALLDEGSGPPRPLFAQPLALDAREGGLRCPECRGSGPAFSPGTLAFVTAWSDPARRKGLRPTQGALAELARGLGVYLAYHVERQPRSLALLPGADGKPAQGMG